MALTPHALRVIAPVIKGEILCLGYPDLLMTPAEASAIVGKPLSDASPHGPKHKLRFPLAQTEEVFAVSGANRVLYLDISPSRDVEAKVDLNYPVNLGTFDLVIDAGTIEHCANIGQALMNAAAAVGVGGHVFHMTPMSMANHGFYNVCPTLLIDFYTQNGWTVKHLSAGRTRQPYDLVPVEATSRFPLQDGVSIYFMAQRVAMADLRWPTQTKYLAKEAA